MKIKTKDLTGAALDWAVATALGYTRSMLHVVDAGRRVGKPAPWGFWDEVDGDTSRDGTFHPSTNWAQGGALIEREDIDIIRCNDLYFPKGNEKGEYYEPYIKAVHPSGAYAYGQTPLIAAMRCFCANRLGDEIEIPDELLEN